MSAVLTITDAAAERARALLATATEPVAGLRLGIRKRGCSGMSYDVQFAREIMPRDEVVADKGVTILIDPAALMFLLGTEMDYVDDPFRTGFVFKNPNETSRCGCGESFSV